MIKKMLFRGGVMIAGLIAAEAVIEKFERASLKCESKSKVADSKGEVKLTKKDIEQAFEKAVEMADELEESVK